MRFKKAGCLNGVGAMHFLLSTVVKHVLKFKYGWCNAPLVVLCIITTLDIAFVSRVGVRKFYFPKVIVNFIFQKVSARSRSAISH